MTAFQRIVVPVDFSEHSSRALDVAIELAKKFDGRLHLVHAYAIHPMLLTPYGVNIPVDFEREFRQAADLQMTACADRPPDRQTVTVGTFLSSALAYPAIWPSGTERAPAM